MLKAGDITQTNGKVLKQLSRLFSRMYSQVGRPSIPPEKLLRALLLQVLYTIRSERMLMEQLNYKCAGINRSEAEDERALRERSSDLVMMEAIPGDQSVTVGADKAYDTQEFVAEARNLKVTPHVAQNNKRRTSAIDGRTTRHAGYAISQQKRKRVEEIFGWLKTVGGMRKLRHRGVELVAGCSPWPRPPTTWCASGIWPRQFPQGTYEE